MSTKKLIEELLKLVESAFQRQLIEEDWQDDSLGDVLTGEFKKVFEDCSPQLAEAAGDVLAQELKKKIFKRQNWLNDMAGDLLAEGLKQAFDNLLRHNLTTAKELLTLLDVLAAQTQNRFHHALALRARGNFYLIGTNTPEQAISYYDQAATIYREEKQYLKAAEALVGKVGALGNLGRFDEAMEVYEEACQILSAHERWLPLGIMSLNLGMTYGRKGNDVRALEMTEQAGELFRRAGAEGEPLIPWVENNRAISLRNLGHFEKALQASQRAAQLLTELKQSVHATRAQHATGLTYFVLGRYNEALELYHQTQEAFIADNRLHDAMLVAVDTSELLLQLGRFNDVLDKCRQIRTLIQPDKHVKASLAILNEGLAYAGLRQNVKALSSFAEVRQLFEEQGSKPWLAVTDLAIATVQYLQGEFGSCLMTARACAELFCAYNLPVKEAQAYLLTAQAAQALHQHEEARKFALKSLQIGKNHDIPFITYQCHHLLGTLELTAGDSQRARQKYEHAITELERLRGQIMVEYRADFLTDKQDVYEDMVELCLDSGQVDLGLQYAERAKSRALLDLLAHRLDLSLKARNPKDAPLVEEIMHLQAERNGLYRRDDSHRMWGEGREMPEGKWSQIQQEIVAKEKQITQKWHSLLVRDADYARDAALWQVRTEEIQPYLDRDTVLVEYFVTHGRLNAFLVTSDSVQARRLSVNLSQIKSRWKMLWKLNLSTVPRSQPKRIDQLTASARASQLRQLYQLLIAPLRDVLSNYRRLIIVPDGFLHKLPFAAFYDGKQFLLEQHEISYLPSASVLRYIEESKPTGEGLTAFGYSHNGHLPERVTEALSIAKIMQGHAFVEEQATLASVRTMAKECRILHLATHGSFRENSLFSGLMLADGYLTTLEVFNQRLNASLVTLSGCQTGQSDIRGGDELLGLMRAFLYAGTKSLVLTHWSVEDRSTALLMQLFYQKLAEGWSKGAALRDAQLQLMHANYDAADGMEEMFAHPFFWASCFLVGDTGHL